MANKLGFNSVIAESAAQAFHLAQYCKPCAITLDLRLPDKDGWALLDRLKQNPSTRHIPVYVISLIEDQARGVKLGAFRCMHKPSNQDVLELALCDLKNYVDKQVKKILIVSSNEDKRKKMIEVLTHSKLQLIAAENGKLAVSQLQNEYFECVVVDMQLEDMSVLNLMNEVILKRPDYLPSMVIYNHKAFTKKEERAIEKYSSSLMIRMARSLEKLLEHTLLFLHFDLTELTTEQKKFLGKIEQDCMLLVGKKVLIIDDDMRNIFALVSALERKQMQVVFAENGIAGIELLQKTSDIDIVLMDIMMPEMDGYETIKHIRGLEEYKHLPIIALTAKAMKGDREKCLQAGANDYSPKPVNIEQLINIMSLWLQRSIHFDERPLDAVAA